MLQHCLTWDRALSSLDDYTPCSPVQKEGSRVCSDPCSKQTTELQSP
jgi:hypothetical protein